MIRLHFLIPSVCIQNHDNDYKGDGKKMGILFLTKSLKVVKSAARSRVVLDLQRVSRS